MYLIDLATSPLRIALGRAAYFIRVPAGAILAARSLAI